MVNGPVQTPAPKAETPATELPQTGDKQGNALAAVRSFDRCRYVRFDRLYKEKRKDEKISNLVR